MTELTAQVCRKFQMWSYLIKRFIILDNNKLFLCFLIFTWQSPFRQIWIQSPKWTLFTNVNTLNPATSFFSWPTLPALLTSCRMTLNCMVIHHMLEYPNTNTNTNTKFLFILDIKQLGESTTHKWIGHASKHSVEPQKLDNRIKRTH